ncbi:MAG: DUF928 domain-containing protein [Myxococcota bacterium]|nr:DUF928 domain-containing protein [Myxococcota bacterium]
MNCEKCNDIDLGEFLLERDEPQWEEFRNHYPGCEDCSREVASWSKLEQLLYAESSASVHPSEEELLGLTTLSLASAQRTAVEAHLSGCAACQSEVALLKRFDFSALAPAPATSAARVGLGERVVESLAAWRESLAGASLQPALMAAAVVLLAIPVGIRLWDNTDASAPSASPSMEMAQQPGPAAEPIPAMIGEPATLEVPEAEIVQLAENTDTPDSLLEPAVPADSQVPAAAAPELLEIAATEPAAPESIPAERLGEPREKPGLVLGEGETMLIAALLPGDMPVYGMEGITGFGGPSVRTGGFVRSIGEAGPSVEVLSPEHVGWTSRPAPTLYWRLSESTNLPVELVIADDVSPEPLLETRLEGVQAAGIQGLSLADRGLVLQPGVTYRWSVSLVMDEERRSRDRFAGSALVYRPVSAPAAADLAVAPVAERAHRLAAQGYWYDAFHQLTLWLEAEPREARLLAHRAALLEQVGLGSEPESE